MCILRAYENFAVCVMYYKVDILKSQRINNLVTLLFVEIGKQKKVKIDFLNVSNKAANKIRCIIRCHVVN